MAACHTPSELLLLLHPFMLQLPWHRRDGPASYLCQPLVQQLQRLSSSLAPLLVGERGAIAVINELLALCELAPARNLPRKLA